MNNIEEAPFILNGIKSWIHCLRCIYKKSEDSTPEWYHYHDYIEILYVVNGDISVWLDGVRWDCCVGDLIIINSEEPHAIICNTDSDYICIKFLPHILYVDEAALFEYKYVVPFMMGRSHQKIFKAEELGGEDVADLIYEIMREWSRRDTTFELIIRADILRIFAAVFRNLYKNKVLSGTTVVTDTAKKALEYIHKNFLTVTEFKVAEYCNVSYNHFSFLFKKAIGKSFVDYVTFLRLREAEKRLLMSDESVTEIACGTGFSTTSYFIFKFKKYKGMTPGQFRKKNRIASEESRA